MQHRPELGSSGEVRHLFEHPQARIAHSRNKAQWVTSPHFRSFCLFLFFLFIMADPSDRGEPIGFSTQTPPTSRKRKQDPHAQEPNFSTAAAGFTATNTATTTDTSGLSWPVYKAEWSELSSFLDPQISFESRTNGPAAAATERGGCVGGVRAGQEGTGAPSGLDSGLLGSASSSSSNTDNTLLTSGSHHPQPIGFDFMQQSSAAPNGFHDEHPSSQDAVQHHDAGERQDAGGLSYSLPTLPHTANRNAHSREPLHLGDFGAIHERHQPQLIHSWMGGGGSIADPATAPSALRQPNLSSSPHEHHHQQHHPDHDTAGPPFTPGTPAFFSPSFLESLQEDDRSLETASMRLNEPMEGSHTYQQHSSHNTSGSHTFTPAPDFAHPSFSSEAVVRTHLGKPKEKKNTGANLQDTYYHTRTTLLATPRTVAPVIIAALSVPSVFERVCSIAP